MFVAKVTGSVVATQKVASMVGQKLLIVEPYRIDEQDRRRRPMAIVPGDHRFQLAHHAAPVGQRHQRVTMRQPIQLGDLRFEPRHLPPQARDLLEHGRGIATLKRHVVHVHSPLNGNTHSRD